MKLRCARLRMGGALFGVLWFAGMILSSQAATVSFRWQQNSEPDLAGYKLYYGPASRTYTNHVLLGRIGTYTMSNLVAGATYYFALAALNTTNAESELSWSCAIPTRRCWGSSPTKPSPRTPSPPFRST